MTVATYQGGRSNAGTAESTGEKPCHRRGRNAKKTTCLPKPAFDEQLPEGVDFSEGGWATDFALALLGLLFFISALQNDQDGDNNDHFVFLQAGTAIAHFFGGLAHRFFPNRASDGEGQTGFYVCMVLGYGGNCMRYGLGWGLHDNQNNSDEETNYYTWLPYVALVNWLYLVVTSGLTVCRMRRTSGRVDDSEGSYFLPDTLYAAGELVVALLEMVMGVVYLVEAMEDSAADAFLVVAVVSHIIGWLAVYVVGGCAFLCSRGYDPSLMQRIFHYALMVMIWAINEFCNCSSDN